MKKILGIIFTLSSSSAFALFCPNGFNQMDIGDTVQQVTTQCGAPASQKTYKVTDDHKPQEWSYYVKVDPTQTASVKMVVGFDANQKVVNITVNTQNLASTPLCNNRMISVGNDTKMVKAACGDPAFVYMSDAKPPNGQSNVTETEVTEFTYATTPPVTLTFENGKLKNRK